VSLGSLLGAWAAVAAVTLWPPSRDGLSFALLVGVVATLALFITVTHRENVGRLVRGTEKRFARLQIWHALARRIRRERTSTSGR
jgi:glycerol-3-phosphate acyltransferase PlsY